MNKTKASLKVLLIAIDDYSITKQKLYGCNNDIEAFKAFLESWVDLDSFHLDIKVLSDHEATYERVTTTFLEHFKNLKDGDVALLYYSGHGSQVPAPVVFWEDVPNHKHESLVLYDSRPQGKDLLDKELAWMIWKVTDEKDVNFTVIFDSCHSGLGTRLEDTLIRRTKETGRARSWKEYLGAEDYIEKGGQVSVPCSSHMLFAACQNFETAKEQPIDGATHGLFSYSLLKALKDSNGRLSFQELAARTQARVYQFSYEQYPQLEPQGTCSPQQLFLNNMLVEKLPWSLVYFDSKMGWAIKAGSLQGIPIEQGDMPTKWRIYPMDTPTEILKEADQAITEVTATKVFSNKSQIADASDLDPRFHYQAILSSIAVTRLKVFLSPDSKKSFSHTIKEHIKATSSLFLEWINEKATADYILIGKANKISVTKPYSIIPVFHPLEGHDEAMISQLFKNLETIAKWHQVQELHHPYSQILDQELSFEFHKVFEADQNLRRIKEKKPIKDFLTKEVVLHYQYNPQNAPYGEPWEEPMFQLKITNTSVYERDLFVTVLFLGSNFCIDASLLSNRKIAYEQEIYLKHWGSPVVRLQLEKEWRTWGINEITEHFKILVSTIPLNPEDFTQPGLPLAVRPISDKRTKRGLAEPKPSQVDATDWRSFDFRIKVVRPTEKYNLQANTATPLSDYGLTITTPKNFAAEVRLGSTKNTFRANRGLDASTNLIESNLMFSMPIGHTPTLDILEFYNVKGDNTIDENHPLIIELGEDLAPNERLIAYGYNDKLGHFIPLGLSDYTEKKRLIIEQLPTSLHSGNRSLGTALKIFFYKTVLEKVGIENEYPILAATRLAADGETVVYQKSLEIIKEKVAKAKRILILVHSIIGNTKTMLRATPKAGTWEEEKWVAMGDHYDLILTFDYENLHTPLEKTAKALQKKLLEVGLHQDDDKTVHLIAHSMGGLIARWLVEKMQGEQLIDHLILVGTPNLGCNWAKVQHMAKWLLTFAFGKLTLAKPLLSALAFLGSYADKTQVTFEQMNASSDFYERLNDGTVAPIPYTIFAGNTTLISLENKMKTVGFFNKIALVLKHYTWYKTLDKTLFREPNDVVVTVKSVFGVPASDLVKHIEVESDHLSYFLEEESLEELNKYIRSLWI